MRNAAKIVFFSIISLLNIPAVSAQPINCSTPAPIGSTADTNPRIIYNEPSGHSAIVTERLSGLKNNKFLVLTDPGADDIFGTEDDTTKNLTWSHPSESDETGVSINQGSMLFARSTKKLGYPGLGPLPQVLSIRLLAAGPDKLFRTSDDSREKVIKAIKYNGNTTITFVQTGIGDGLLAWVYGKRSGSVENVYVGGCDTTIRRGRPGSCTRKTLYEKHLPANLIGGALPAVVNSPILPVRLHVGSHIRPVALFKIGDTNNQHSLIFRMDTEQIFDAGLGDKTPMTWMANNQLFTSHPDGDRLGYELGTPGPSWTFQAPQWTHLPEVPPESNEMQILSLSDTEDNIAHTQAYIGTYRRRVKRLFHTDRHYIRYYFVRPLGGGNAFFGELEANIPQPDNFVIRGDTVAFHMYDPGNGAYTGVGVMTCR